MARHLFTSTKTIYRIENNLHIPHFGLQQRILSLAKTKTPNSLPQGFSTFVIDPEVLHHYVHAPVTGWRHWTRKKRGQFRRWRLYYRRILAEAEAGRCLITYAYREKAAKPAEKLRKAGLI